ncbi:hypothetical protein NDR87_03625 [Nocardia sp. CDC159]|uniref:Uncharacterized protein n=1 Tax=Nocardia pulmonis TaxID=2951408 RepID=A0A9X2IUY8_9NOCA|nr:MULTISPECIES: hypothetical protein [Nocardia]MCM6771894.1 hypothetical protein [Nocardia pulmonis]MCM6785448.1 hypothetical protein [Nocardia sp. CDC159]
MLKAIENLGATLLGKFVPAVEAEAMEAKCWPGSWKKCWQCNGRPCTGVCCDTGSCYDIRCL